MSAFSLNAHATLTSYTSNGVDLVYSSVSDVTWTKDANLLGTLFASQGFNTVVNAIIASSPTISNTPNAYNPTGTYTLSASDFRSDGSTTWFGALGYINYLNSINYAGSNQWYLPTVANATYGYNTTTNGTAKGDELVELYYQELGSKGHYDSNGSEQPDYGIKDPQNKFIHEQFEIFWTGTEHAPKHFVYAWIFGAYNGAQYGGSKDATLSAWAVSAGRLATPVSSVPEPECAAMLLLGLGLVGFASRRQSK